METKGFHIVEQIPAGTRATAAALFWQAFGGKLNKVMGPEQRAIKFLTNVLDPTHGIGAVTPNGQLIGIAGFKTDHGAMVGGEYKDMRRVYGIWGGLWRGLSLTMLERPVEQKVLLMDGISVAEEVRGLGVGTALLNAIKARAQTLGKHAVRLDVIDTNPHAKALYLRQGFEPVSEVCLGPFAWLFGFRKATTLQFKFERLNNNH